MPGEEPFRVAGVVVARLAERLFRVRLANGHELYGHVPRRDLPGLADAGPGESVLVEISPYDLSKGRIRRKLEVSHES